MVKDIKEYKATLSCNGKVTSVNLTKVTLKHWYLEERRFRKEDGLEVGICLKWKLKGILSEVTLK